MEEILSSIRRVIARDDPSQTAPVFADVADSDGGRESGEEDDVLDLTDASADDEEQTDVATPSASPASSALLADEPAAASRQSLDVLAAMLAGGQDAAHAVPAAAGDITVNALVEAAVRPMLKSWLDANLPTVVERLVAREIARITGTRL